MPNFIDVVNDQDALQRAFQETEELERQCLQDGDVIRFPDAGNYKIALGRCNTAKKILDWVDHLCEKPWMTTQLVRRFINLAAAAHEIDFNNQA